MSVDTEIKSLGLKLDKVGENIESVKDFGTQIKSLQDAVADMQTKNAHGAYVDACGNATVSPEVKGMLDYIAGRSAAPETKTASIANPATGGYLAVPEFINQVVPKLSEKSPLLPEITSFTVNAGVTSIPVEVAEPKVNWVGEMQERGETDVGLGMANIPLNELNTTIGLTNLLLRTSNLLNAEGYVVGRVTDSLSKGIGEAILMGNGDKKPMGILSDKRIKTVKSSIKANDIVEKLFEVIGDAPSELVNPKWVMASSTFWAIAKQFGKDSTYVNMPLSENIEARILGRPVVICDAPAMVSGNVGIAYGDMKLGYYGVQSTGMSFVRDEITAANRGITKLIYSTYFGGQVVNPDAFRTITFQS